MSDQAGCTMRYDSHDDLRQKAWMNLYSAARQEGIQAHIAAERADYFITKRFDGLIDDLRKVMAERA
jgi:hypothetical protein